MYLLVISKRIITNFCAFQTVNQVNLSFLQKHVNIIFLKHLAKSYRCTTRSFLSYLRLTSHVLASAANLFTQTGRRPLSFCPFCDETMVRGCDNVQ